MTDMPANYEGAQGDNLPEFEKLESPEELKQKLTEAAQEALALGLPQNFVEEVLTDWLKAVDGFVKEHGSLLTSVLLSDVQVPTAEELHREQMKRLADVAREEFFRGEDMRINLLELARRKIEPKTAPDQ